MQEKVYGDWVVLADIGTDWPEVFGPYVNLSEAQGVEDTLRADRRVFNAEVAASIRGDCVGEYLQELDEVIAP